MSRYESIAQMRAVRRTRTAERFQDHRAARVVFADGVEQISWRKPGTGIDSITFLIHGPHLIVTGDLGDAIYTRECGWKFWASCDLDYFASKCVASETGRLSREWDDDRAELYLASVFETTVDGLRDDGSSDAVAPMAVEDDDDAEGVRTELRAFRERGGASALHSEFEWVSWLHENGHDVFGDDYYEHGAVGKDVSHRCLIHLEGLKAAVRQLGLIGQERAA